MALVQLAARQRSSLLHAGRRGVATTAVRLGGNQPFIHVPP
eukprot:CAMPEP_0194750492 /NCGR_PEP_ID=MMETSP0323_2-20130528/4563_1 /TAXON_ID=2866 ORGANISM="Crypthecodinium cohnii, Strain Seligo" /NCGR_SAMPLE_ID=MMETSP0323_2 /ASSEMBLY_ACC=CAM_ASM_000346 /LENGTH=40 /DNA_ID= /DNA_START= /DNA_END= /DNA_ORIENTATION=